MKLRSIFLTASIILPCALQADIYSKFKSDHSICVAYKTTKGMFYVSDVVIIGVNCDVQFEKSKNTVRVTIPVRKFDSDNSKRDSEVALILGGPESIPLKFEVQIPKDATKNFIPKTVTGTLFVKGKANKIQLSLSRKTDKIRFEVNTKFSTLGVKVDSVGPGGFIAKPQDGLTLYGQIPLDRIFQGK